MINTTLCYIRQGGQCLMLHRVSGFTFDYGIFTNLAEDHIGKMNTRI